MASPPNNFVSVQLIGTGKLKLFWKYITQFLLSLPVVDGERKNTKAGFVLLQNGPWCFFASRSSLVKKLGLESGSFFS